MKDKNLLDDIKNKSLNELTEMANNITHNLEKENNLENSMDEYQKLIKRYEQSPTNSHPKKSCAKLSAVINISIPNVKNER